MKNKRKLGLIYSFILLCSIAFHAYGQDISYVVTNPRHTYHENDTFYLIDVIVFSNQGLLLGSGQIYFLYDTLAFGPNVVYNEKVEIYLSEDAILSKQISDGQNQISFYNTFILNDSQDSVFSFSWQKNKTVLWGDAENIDYYSDILLTLKLNLRPGFGEIEPYICFSDDGLRIRQTLKTCLTGMPDTLMCSLSSQNIINDERYFCDYCPIVYNTFDSGPGSLRYAIECAERGDTIRFAKNMINSTILISSNKIELEKDVFIVVKKDHNIEVDGTFSQRIFEISADTYVFLEGLSITSGLAENGSAIINEGDLTLKDLNIYFSFPNTSNSQVINNGNLQIDGNVSLIKRGMSTAGTISDLDCSSTILSGVLIAGYMSSAVSAEVNYSGGDGGPHIGNSVSSTGVLGLTASTPSGNFETGSGILTYNISGTPDSSGTAYFSLNIGGESCLMELFVTSGTITGINCLDASITGSLVENVPSGGILVELLYSGGNGGIHQGQTVNSTGVAGLLASTPPANFELGDGILVFEISGTPLGSGIAVFAIDIGGQSCLLEISVASGEITNLNCTNAYVSGDLVVGVETTNVTAELQYVGGNGGPHIGQITNSIGVAGLTATLDSGNFEIGNGILVYLISGIPSDTGIAMFTINIGGQACNLEIAVVNEAFICGTTTVSFIYNNAEVTYGTVMSSGRCWLDRNLGASQVATSSIDALAYGDLFQWGRLDDGHQSREPLSGTTTSLSSSDNPGHNYFILSSSNPYDWRIPQNNSLWQGINGINNPCPDGFRIPSEAEINDERLSWNSNNSDGAFNSPLKLTAAGTRGRSSGMLANVGTFGYYWTNTVVSTNSQRLYFGSSQASMASSNRASGMTVRCIKH